MGAPSTVINRAAHALAKGGSFPQFAGETRKAWEHLARGVFRRAGYTSLELEDLVQVMLLAAWEALPAWEPARSGEGSLAKHLIFNALVAARRAALEAKGLHGRGRNQPVNTPGRYLYGYETALAEGDEAVMAEAPEAPDVVAERREHVGAYLRHATERDAVLVMEALRWGSIHVGAVALCKDAALCDRLELRGDDPNWTRRVVRRAVKRTITRAGEANGNETKEGNGEEGEAGRRGAPRQGGRSVSAEGVPAGGEGLRSHGRAPDAAAKRQRTRPRGRRCQPGALVQGSHAG